MSQNVIKFYRQSEVPYGVFSNFPFRPIELDGKTWNSSEIYFQAMKFAGTEHEDIIAEAATSKLAAQMGRDRSRPLRPDWDEVVDLGTEDSRLQALWERYVNRPCLLKDYVMFKAVLAKFTQHEDLGALLLATEDALIVEHTEVDSYWADGGDGSGLNMLGRILMIVRELLDGERQEKTCEHC